MFYRLLNLPADKLAKIQAIEAETDHPLLAFSEVQASPAQLDRETLAKIRALEEDLGIVLLAVTDPNAPVDNTLRRGRLSRRR
jgi:hypothetical protein